MADATAKLAQMLQPILTEAVKDLKQHETVGRQEILLQIQEVAARLTVLEQAVSTKKVSKPRATKGAAAPADGQPAPADGQPAPAPEAGAAGAVEAAAGAGVKFPINKLHYFKGKWKESPDFRAKYMAIPELKAFIDGNAEVQKKTKPDQKIAAESQVVWNWLRDNRTAIHEEIGQEYEAAKAKHNTANKSAQNVAEPGTPPAETAK
jgi:hypothetical protein